MVMNMTMMMRTMIMSAAVCCLIPGSPEQRFGIERCGGASRRARKAEDIMPAEIYKPKGHLPEGVGFHLPKVCWH